MLLPTRFSHMFDTPHMQSLSSENTFPLWPSFLTKIRPLYCILSHVGLSGNEKADVLTKRTIQLPPPNHNALPLQDYVPSIFSVPSLPPDSPIETSVFRIAILKFVQLKHSFGPWCSCSQWCCHLEVISYAGLTHGHLMALEATPICGCCQVRLLVFHVLVECHAYSVACNGFFPSLTSIPPCECLFSPFLSFLFLAL